MNPKRTLLGLSIMLVSFAGFSQVSITEGPAEDPDPAAILDLKSTSKGFLTPRMTESQKNSIIDPAKGLLIYQTDGAEGFYYNFGTSDAPNWKKMVDNSGPQGYWTQNGSDIYYSTGKVGIGTNTPAATLDVNGPAWFKDSLSVDGSAGRLFLNGASSTEPAIRWAYEGSSKMRLRYRLSDASLGEPHLMINSDLHEDVWGITRYGRVRQDYKGTFQAYVLYSSAPRSALYIDNDNDLAQARCISVALSDLGASAASIAIAAWNNGDGSALYAENEKNDNFTYLGTENYGAHGENGTSNFWGTLGGETSGVFGHLGDGAAPQSLTPGDFAVKGHGVELSSQDGVGYEYNETIGGVLGYNPESTSYSFGVSGYLGASYDGRSGGVFGAFHDAALWGALAYAANNNQEYAGYFSGNNNVGNGNGDNTGSAFSSIGIGAWGDLFGAKIKGEVYGLYTEGENYGLYAHGDVYRTGADVHMQKDEEGNNQVMYTLVSTDMIVQTYGVGQLERGKANIAFDRSFAEVVSDTEPIVVTITPIGKSKGIYLEDVQKTGFSAAENDRGKSSVQFSWIAIGKRKGFEDIQLPREVVAADYDEKIKTGLTNDNDPSADGSGLYYQDGNLVNGQLKKSVKNTSNITDYSKKKKGQVSIESPEGTDGD
jgi:hypothetical protein